MSEQKEEKRAEKKEITAAMLQIFPLQEQEKPQINRIANCFEKFNIVACELFPSHPTRFRNVSHKETLRNTSFANAQVEIFALSRCETGGVCV